LPENKQSPEEALNKLSFQASKHIVIIDADYELYPNFLQETIPLLERDEKVAYVMTPQNLVTEKSSPVEDANILLTHFTWQMLHKGVAHNGRVLFGGTNAAIRLSALKDIAKERKNGAFDYIPSDTVTEDLSASLYFFEKGYDAKFIPTPLAKGQPIHSLADHFSTYWRYTEGSLENTLKQTIPYAFKNPRFFASWEGLEYINKGVQAFYGAMVGFFGIAPLLASYGINFPAAIPAPLLLYFLTMANSSKTITRQLGKKGVFDHFKTAALIFVHFPVFLHGFAAGIKNVILGKQAAFQRTSKDGNRSIVPLKYLIPLLAMGTTNVYCALSYLFQFASTPVWWLLENFGWASFQSTAILGSLFWFNGFKNTISDLYHGFKNLGSKAKGHIGRAYNWLV
jgi:cellulose synthase/poly-beta-1,6-N-acetylglucosamine synthase-like glycosyltransferase